MVQNIYQVCAQDQDVNDAIRIDGSLPPSGKTSYFIKRPDSGDNPACYDFKWTPRLGDTDFTMCFKATDNGAPVPKKSLGSYCVLMKVLVADTLYISGILRDFRKSHPDFALPIEHGDDQEGRNFVADKLGPNGDIELLVGPGQSTPGGTTRATGLGQAPPHQGPGFYDWFHTDANPDKAQARNMLMVHSEALSDTSNTGVFTFFTTSFWPVDNQLFGNEGDLHNRYFTWEIRTYLTYNPKDIYTFASADDMWVFVDGRLPPSWILHGVHPIREQRLDLKTFGLLPNVTYRCDIFYAHRSSLHDSAIKIQLPEFFLCDGLSQGSPVIDWSSGFGPAQQYGLMAFSGAIEAATAYVSVSPDVASPALTALQLIAADRPGQSSAAYFGQNGAPARLKLLNGFRFEFTFMVRNTRCATTNTRKPCAEGFSVILHASDNPTARGGAGSNLGYAAIDRAFVIEFDFNYSPEQLDPDFSVAVGSEEKDQPWPNNTYGQISVHTRFDTVQGTFPPVSASELDSIASSRHDPRLNLANGTKHFVRIDYQPGQLIGEAQQPGWLRVYVNEQLGPLCEAVVEPKSLERLLGGAAYLGFTAANSESRQADTLILGAKLLLVPVDPTQSHLVDNNNHEISALPAALAGSVLLSRVLTQNTCGDRLLVGGEAHRFASTLLPRTCISPEAILHIPAQDNQDGSYTFTLVPTLAATYDFNISFDNVNIRSSPLPLLVGRPRFPARTVMQFSVSCPITSTWLLSTAKACL
eukprot:g10197.t1